MSLKGYGKSTSWVWWFVGVFCGWCWVYYYYFLFFNFFQHQCFHTAFPRQNRETGKGALQSLYQDYCLPLVLTNVSIKCAETLNYKWILSYSTDIDSDSSNWIYIYIMYWWKLHLCVLLCIYTVLTCAVLASIHSGSLKQMQNSR